MRTRSRVDFGALVLFLVYGAAACINPDKDGACVSGPVSYSFGVRVYCYSGWAKNECQAYNRDEVNGASWSFHSGQSCGDRDLDDGSNPWP